MYGNHEGTSTYIASYPLSGKSDPSPERCTLIQNDVFLGPDVPMVYAMNGSSGPFYGGGPSLQFNYHPRLAESLRESGFSIVSTANNHCLDRGYLGVNHTLDNLDAHGIQHAGTRRKPLDKYQEFYEIVCACHAVAACR
jgi:poly-gamma-glutamate synthesis protein (capsule biosynthesis protein)